MTKSVAFLGRQPALGRAELESLYGAAALQPVGTQQIVIDRPPRQIDFARLGGSLKLGKLLAELPTTRWPELIKYLCDNVPLHLKYIPEGKIRFGLDVHGFANVSVRHINAAGLSVKKSIRQAGRSVRVVPNTALELSSAQTLHNKMTCPIGLELALVKNGSSTLLVQITNVQDIDAYAARDQQRPKRDAQVGMLPPKLAQIILNLTVGPRQAVSVLDPFCGTGVLLQEALLMGYQVYGSDLEPRMIEYSRTNLDWLAQSYRLSSDSYHLAQADATTHRWSPRPDVIACETYLGTPFATPPRPDVLTPVVHHVNIIHRKFLQNVAQQFPSGTPLCVAVPAWPQKQGFRHLPVLDSLGEMGYTRHEFVHAAQEELVYHRPSQMVARELVVLKRI